MSAPELRSYRVSLVGGRYAVWVTAESRNAACEVAERMWRDRRSAFPPSLGAMEWIEVLDEYEEGGAA